MKRYTVLLLIGVLLALILASAGGAAAEPSAPDVYSFPVPGEPNDTFATANDAYEGYLMTPTDVDYLRFELEVGTWIMPGVGLDRDWDTPPLLRVQLAVFNSAQTLLAEDADCNEKVSIPAIEAAAGLYYLRVRACIGYFDSDQPYGAYVGTIESFEREPNNSFAAAQLIDLSVSTFGLYSTAADLDYYRIELPSATLLSYFVQPRSSSWSLRSELALYDSAHTLLEEDADCNNSTELETPVGAGTYFLSVRPCAGTVDPTVPYVLTLYGEPLEAEPNDSFATAMPQALGDYWDSYVMGFLPAMSDKDYYRIDLQTPVGFRPQVYLAYSFGGVTLVLYDSAYTELARETDSTLAVYLNPGTYYLLVEPLTGVDADQPYKLAFHWLPYEVEPNDSWATATTMDQDGMAGAIQPAGDVDFYRFEGHARSRLLVGVSESGSTMNPEVALLAADGTVLASKSEQDCLFNCYVDLEYTLSADTTYYLRIRSLMLPVGVGDYTVWIRESPNDTTDLEPNDTPAQAVPAVYGDTLSGLLEDSDVIDYYRFTGQGGDEVVLADWDCRWSSAEVTLYDPSMSPVPLNGGVPYWTTLPTTGVYTLSFHNTGAYAAGDSYGSTLLLTTGDEPNNTMATATVVAFGPRLAVTHDYLDDTDWFRFQGRAGDVLRQMNTSVVDENVFLYAADGSYLGTHVLPADGTYYLEVNGSSSDKWDTYCYEGLIDYPFGEALWVSAAVDGLGGNAAIKRGDIATRKTAANQWQIVFDASDVGITQNVAAFERMPNGSILMSLGGGQNVPGLGQVAPQDIIRFSPTALGDTTAGTFQWFLDGSDVGLTTAAEKIDAISMQADVTQPLRVSIAGGGSVPRQSGGALKVADEDVINFVATSYGANSAGLWRVSLDGSTVPGMATEDVTAMTRVEMFPQRDSQTLLSYDSGFTINGQQGTTFDVVYMDSWRTAVQHLTDKKIDGLAVGPAWTP